MLVLRLELILPKIIVYLFTLHGCLNVKVRVQTFLGDLKKSLMGDVRRPYLFKKETNKRLKRDFLKINITLK